MAETHPITFLCMASYFKGAEFMQECKRQGSWVILLTNEKLLDANWPRDSIDEIHAMPDLYNHEHVIKGVSFLARTRIFDIIVALDDFEVETAAKLREHLRIPGMGDTTARYFRDKLAIVCSDNWQRVNTLIGSYTERFRTDFHASMPVPDKPSG